MPSYALRIMIAAPWPGNVRELASVIERAVVFESDVAVGVEDISCLRAVVAEPAIPWPSTDAEPWTTMRPSIPVTRAVDTFSTCNERLFQDFSGALSVFGSYLQADTAGRTDHERHHPVALLVQHEGPNAFEFEPLTSEVGFGAIRERRDGDEVYRAHSTFPATRAAPVGVRSADRSRGHGVRA